jgi:WD40 repeat protein
MTADSAREATARRLVEQFRRRFPEALPLAYHAALPVVLNAELLHLLRTNFFLDSPEPIPYLSESDLLLSPLCRESGDGLYELDPHVRKVLLDGLVKDARYGMERIRQVASLLWLYGKRAAPWADRPSLERAQELTAVNFLDPVAARRWLAEAERQSGGTGHELSPEWFVAMRREIDLPTAIRPQGEPPVFYLLLTFRGHTDSINRIAWSPDGDKLASGCDDGTIRVWNMKNGELLNTLVAGAKILSLAWSPDGQKLASGSGDNTIRLWDTETWTEFHILEGHTNSVHSVAWSPDGQKLASGSSDNTIRVWKAGTWEVLRTLTQHSDYVYSVAWSPDGRRFASGSFDRIILLWDAGPEEVTRRLVGHTDNVFSVAWSPDGRTLASGSYDKTIQIWDIETGSTTILKGHTNTVRSVSFSYDGRLLASKAADDLVGLWRCDTWAQVAELPEQASDAWAASLAFHPNSAVLATLGEKDKVIRIWDVDVEALLHTWVPLIRELKHNNPVHRFSWNADGSRLAVPSRDGTVTIWDMQSVKEAVNRVPDAGDRAETIQAGKAGVNQVAWMRMNGWMIAAACFDRQVGLFPIEDSRPSEKDKWDRGTAWRSLDGDVPCVQFSPDGRFLAAGTMVGTLWVWDVSRMQQIARFACGTAVWDLAWHPRSGLAVGGTDKVLLVDFSGNQKPRMIDELHAVVSCLAWSADGRWLLIGNWKGELWIVDGAELASHQFRKIHDGRITSLSLAAGDRLLATKSEDGTTRLWRPTKSEDGTTRLWRPDLWELACEIREPIGASPEYATVAFHPTEAILASVGDDGRTVRVRSVDSGTWDRAPESHRPSPPAPPRHWVVVAGTGKINLADPEVAAARRLGRALGECGYGLITGGWEGVDHVAARAFCHVVEALGAKAEEHLVNVVIGDNFPDFNRGRVERASSNAGSYMRSVELSHAVVLVGGRGGTWELGQVALEAGKPVLPLAGTGGDAGRMFRLISEDWDRLHPGRVPRDLFEALKAPGAEAAGAAIACLAALFGDKTASRAKA